MKAAGGPPEIAIFVIECRLDDDIRRLAIDLFETNAHRQRAPNGALKCTVMPDFSHALHGGEALVRREIPDGERSIADMPADHARDEVAKFTHVPGIFARQQIIADSRIGFRGRPRTVDLLKKVASQRQDIFSTFAQRR
jgi:hypothetical protein